MDTNFVGIGRSAFLLFYWFFSRMERETLLSWEGRESRVFNQMREQQEQIYMAKESKKPAVGKRK
jgi:hypothetical protein